MTEEQQDDKKWISVLVDEDFRNRIYKAVARDFYDDPQKKAPNMSDWVRKVLTRAVEESEENG